jgi:hypothetical protein
VVPSFISIKENYKMSPPASPIQRRKHIGERRNTVSQSSFEDLEKEMQRVKQVCELLSEKMERLERVCVKKMFFLKIECN